MPNLLLIDAEKEFAEPLAAAVSGWGYEITWTADGKDGLDKAASMRPSAIVLCVELGKMSGYSICNKLKKDEALKDIPLIITSREATQETFEQHKKLKTRAEAYLIKPFKPSELKQVLGQLLGAEVAETSRPAGGAELKGDLTPLDLQEGGSPEEDIVLDDLPAGAKEEAFDPGALVGAESRDADPLDALEGFEIAGDDDPDRDDGATRIMTAPPKTAAKPVAAPAPAPKPMAATVTGSGTVSPVARTAAAGKPVTDDERRQLEQKLQEAKTKAATSAQEVDKLRAEMNQLRTKSREETASLRAQLQELTEKFKTEQAALKQRYEDTTNKAVAEATTLRQQVKDVQTRAQGEIEQLRGQLIEIRNQSQDLLTNKDSEMVNLKKRAAELEAAVESLRAETSRNEKIRERTVKAVDVALQLLQDDDTAAA